MTVGLTEMKPMRIRNQRENSRLMNTYHNQFHRNDQGNHCNHRIETIEEHRLDSMTFRCNQRIGIRSFYSIVDEEVILFEKIVRLPLFHIDALTAVALFFIASIIAITAKERQNSVERCPIRIGTLTDHHRTSRISERICVHD